MKKKYILIKADVNDADYINSKNIITDDELEHILPVIDAIKEYDNDETIKHQKYNWWTVDNSSRNNPSPSELYVESGKCSQEAFDHFNDYLPSMDNESIHTIESIEILVVENEIKLL